MITLCFKFDEKWLDRRSSVRKAPLTDLKKYFESIEQGVRVLSADGYSVSVELDESLVDPESFIRDALAFLAEKHKISAKKMPEVLSVMVTQDDQEEGSETEDEDEDEFFSAPVDEEALGDVLSAIERLRGADEFKEICAEIHRMAPVLREREIRDVVTARAYLFSIDEGFGLNTSVNLLTALLVQERLFRATDIAISAKLIPYDENTDVLAPVEEAMSQLSGRIAILDISAWIDMIDSPRFASFMEELGASSDGLIYVFRVPFMEQNILTKISEQLSDVILVRPVSFVPLSNRELKDSAENMLESYGFDAEEDAWEMFRQRMAEEKSDGKFYGIHTAQKIVQDMVYQKLRSMSSDEIALQAGKSSDEQPELIHIYKEDLEGFIRNRILETPVEEELGTLVSASKLKDDIYKILEDISASKDSDRPMNMRFIGSPGTGKTTVARMVGRLMKEKGLLEDGFLYEHSSKDLIPDSQVQAAPSVMAICTDARGSVLYIDELYHLIDAASEGNESALAAIETLTSKMKSGTGDMLIIMAGDEYEMEKLISLDESFREYIPYTLDFPDYSRAELAGIFMDMLRRSGLKEGDGLKNAVEGYFEKLKDGDMRSSDFSNARFVRNLFESTLSKSIMRSQMEGGEKDLVKKEDFMAASSHDVERFFAKQSRRPRPGYHIGLV